MTQPNDERHPMYLVTDDNGSPIGMFDADQIIDEGHKLAFGLAAVCDDPAALLRLQEETLARVGPDSFGYITGNALAVMAQHILGPSFELCRTFGVDVQAAMQDIAEGREPGR